MVAPEADHLIRRPCLEIDQEVDDSATIRPLIDIVATKISLILRAGISLAKLDELAKLPQTSVNVDLVEVKLKVTSFVLTIEARDGPNRSASANSLKPGSDFTANQTETVDR
jgi:hypothetical protein